jgi:hypothetical protein
VRRGCAPRGARYLASPGQNNTPARRDSSNSTHVRSPRLVLPFTQTDPGSSAIFRDKLNASPFEGSRLVGKAGYRSRRVVADALDFDPAHRMRRLEFIAFPVSVPLAIDKSLIRLVRRFVLRIFTAVSNRVGTP